MEHEKSIREQGRFAQRLAEDIRSLFESVPFGSEVYRASEELARLARPVVAVTGARGVGKSTLLRALDGARVLPAGASAAGPDVSDPPEGASRPWEWLEVSSDAQAAETLSARAGLCVLVTSALQALPPEELTQLQQLAGSAPDIALRVVLTRVDELPAGELLAMKERVRKLLVEALPGRTIAVSVVSGRTGEGVPELREELASALFRVQRDRLLEEVEAWGAALLDLRALLEMRELAAVKPETIDRVSARLDALLREEGARLRSQLPAVAEQFQRDTEPKLPRPQRQLTKSLQEALVARLRAGVEGVHSRLNEELARALREDVDTATTLALTDRFQSVLKTGPRFFDWQSATKVGAVSAAGAALLARAKNKPSGWALAGAALLGGLLGGLMGNASTVETPAALRDQVTEPQLRDAEQRLLRATESSREDLARLCELLRKVIHIFTDPKAAGYELASLQREVAQARERHEQLANEVRAFVQNLEAEALLEQLNIRIPGAPGPADAEEPTPGALPAGRSSDHG
ncbi:hypothetical protein [Hyalangium versicolor]|uniref:hypothetical protein n=1 Tax=Hyalangium versicolor TaxID=2861190 RepID=UPI001CCB40FC|nr:hypothetical protein [Hyalangium versicolor]